MVIDESRLQPCTCKILWQVKSELAVDNCEANEPRPDQFIKGKPGGFQSRGNPRLRASRSYVVDTSARPELKVISQPKRVAPDDRDYHGYYFDPTAKNDTMVYVLDTRLQMEHEVSRDFVDQVCLWKNNTP